MSLGVLNPILLPIKNRYFYLFNKKFSNNSNKLKEVNQILKKIVLICETKQMWWKNGFTKFLDFDFE